MVSLNETEDLALVMPVVPIMDMPPIMPSLELVVAIATSSPSGADMTTSTPREVSSLTESRIIRLGPD